MALYIEDSTGKRVKISGGGTPGKDGKSAYEVAVENGYSGTEEEFNSALSEVGKKDIKTFQATASASGWSNSSNTIMVSGLSADAAILIGIDDIASDDQWDAATKANLRAISQAENSVTITAKGTVPTVDLPILIYVW